MPPKPKTESERQQFRTLIISAARELFVSRGVEAVTMREIAKRIGYSATSIYLHFADKDAVIRAICDTDFLDLATSLKDDIQISDPVERMEALGHGYAKFALSHPNHYRLMFMAARIPYNPAELSLQKHTAEQDAYFQLKTVVSEVYAAGRFKAEYQDMDLIAQTFWAGIHGVCSLEINMACSNWVNWTEISDRLKLMQTVLVNGFLRESR